jgi:hypothetical protein
VLDVGSTIRAAAWRFVLQRASAAVLALCVVVHLATIIYAVRHGLTSDAMIARIDELSAKVAGLNGSAPTKAPRKAAAKAPAKAPAKRAARKTA